MTSLFASARPAVATSVAAACALALSVFAFAGTVSVPSANDAVPTHSLRTVA